MANLSVVVCIEFDHRASSSGLAAFKACLRQCPFVDTTMDVSGTFDMIVQGHCASLAEYTEHMDMIRGALAEFVARIETNFVSSKVERTSEHEEKDALWLPCEGDWKRVDADMIDKIVAEGDYMRVHVGSWGCLIHQTMRRLSERLGTANFIKLHRSCLVRIGFIDRLVHEERRWKARLRDGTYVSVAKSHVQEVLRMMSSDSAKHGPISSNSRATDDGSAPVNENIMRLKM
jgi:hypothetical protein